MADSSAQQFVRVIAARAGTLAMGVIASVVIARALPPEARGTYYVAVTFGTTAMALGHLSVEQAQTALWSDKGKRTLLESNSVPLGLLVGVVAALLAMAAAVAFQGHGNLPGPWLLAAACANVPPAVGVLYASNIAVLRDRSREAGLAALVAAAVQCGCLVALGVTGHITVYTVVIVWSASSLVSLAVLIGSGGVAVARPRMGLARVACLKGLRLHAGSAAAFLLLRSDVFLLNALAGSHAVGVYTLAVTLAELSRVAVDVFAQITLPRQFDHDKRGAVPVVVRNVRLMALLSAASALTAVAAVAVLIRPVYGAAYADAATLTAWLVPGVLLLSAGRPVSTFLLRFRSARSVVLPSLLALGVNTGLNLLLIPAWGAVGCAIASTVAYLTVMGAQFTLFLRDSGTRWWQLLPTGVEAAQLMDSLRHRHRSPA
ncbi:lipopolysaccharide biosynthesis protein [Streptomyces sp. NPDC127084]|uniref:lipopolysaccharide biosynthesis protein n=1 Tax=Streptomyces sp. NPDC127084 TaxID=3347133 RepID=UPI0036646CF8